LGKVRKHNRVSQALEFCGFFPPAAMESPAAPTKKKCPPAEIRNPRPSIESGSPPDRKKPKKKTLPFFLNPHPLPLFFPCIALV